VAALGAARTLAAGLSPVLVLDQLDDLLRRPETSRGRSAPALT
jgi:hypothetical protein